MQNKTKITWDCSIRSLFLNIALFHLRYVTIYILDDKFHHPIYRNCSKAIK